MKSQQPKKTLLSWSSGKDSAWALYQLQQDPAYEVTGLFTTVNSEFSRVAMHGIRTTLLKAQADAVALPVTIIEIPWPCSNEAYAEVMQRFVRQCEQESIEVFAFGDLYLEDIRDYRIKNLANSPIKPHFPLWKIPTAQLAAQMIEQGLKAYISCVDTDVLDQSFAGLTFSEALPLLPKGVDPCAENGEFHTFVVDGPMFKHAIDVEIGEVVERDRFIYADIKPQKC